MLPLDANPCMLFGNGSAFADHRRFQSDFQFTTFLIRRMSIPPAAEGIANANDAALIARIHLGDERAFAALYDRYSQIVYAVALRILGNTGSAEDVLQEIFMQLWRKPEAFDASRGSLPGWLAVITRHRAIDYLRHRRPETDIEDVVVAAQGDLAQSAELSVLLSKARQLIESLPQDQSKLLQMAFFEGLTHSEIAEKTGEPLGTVKTRIRAGLTTIRKGFKV